ncbi:MAG: hypothetical protein IJ128_06655 [Firmicutes bacterium]|nr:hypothetical protein [Bacillota bacterium]
MNTKVALQIACFLVMFALEMIAAYVDPASPMYTILLVLALLMIPAFVLVKYIPSSIETTPEIKGAAAEAA